MKKNFQLSTFIMGAAAGFAVYWLLRQNKLSNDSQVIPPNNPDGYLDFDLIDTSRVSGLPKRHRNEIA